MWRRSSRVSGSANEQVADAELIIRSRRGDQEAFGELYRRYHPRVRGLCRRLAGETRADDITQETFLRALAHLDRFIEGREIWPWLATIARRLCIDELRDPPTPEVSLDGEIIEAVRAPVCEDTTVDAVFARLDRARIRRRLDRALAALTERDRRIVLMRSLESESYERIAGAEGTSVNAVRNVVWRARNLLQSLLREERDAAFGLLAGLVSRLGRPVRRLRDRAAAFVNRLPAVTTDAIAEPFAAAALTVLVLTGGWSQLDRGGDRIVALESSAVAGTPQAETEEARVHAVPRRADAASPFAPGPSGPIRTTIEAEPPRQGRAIPPSTNIRIEVVGPNGRVLYWSDTSIACSKARPPFELEGPVRDGC